MRFASGPYDGTSCQTRHIIAPGVRDWEIAATAGYASASAGYASASTVSGSREDSAAKGSAIKGGYSSDKEGPTLNSWGNVSRTLQSQQPAEAQTNKIWEKGAYRPQSAAVVAQSPPDQL